MSKKSSRERRSHDLRIRLTEKEKRCLVQLAQNRGLTVSAWVRHLTELSIQNQADVELERICSQLSQINFVLRSSLLSFSEIERTSPNFTQLYQLQYRLNELSRQIQEIRRQLRI